MFASCSADGNIAIWDTRSGKSPVISFKAHDADVNVISWNRLMCLHIVYHGLDGISIWQNASTAVFYPFRLASCMLASGSDDGTFSIRDLRLLMKKVLILSRSVVVRIDDSSRMSLSGLTICL